MRKLKVVVAMLAIVLMAASPAMAQPSVEFVKGGVLIIGEGTGSLEEQPITGLFAIPEFGVGAVSRDAGVFANPNFGAGAFVGGSTAIGSTAGDVFLQSGSLCFDTTDMDLCP